MAKYQSVNEQWPESETYPKPTPQEALSGARRLYRFIFKRPFRGKMQLTSGNRYTSIRRGVFYVNPDCRGRGWHELVHDFSHYACNRLHPTAPGHGFQHAFIEREMIRHVVQSGWLDGKLRREQKPKPDAVERRRQSVLRRLEGWKRTAKRAHNAIRKLERQRRYYEAKA